MTILCPRVNLFLKTAVYAAFRVFRKVFSRLLRMGDCLWRFFVRVYYQLSGRGVSFSSRVTTVRDILILPPLFQGLFYARRINMQNKNKNVTFFEIFFSLNFHNFFCWKNEAKMQQKSETEGLAFKLIAVLRVIFCQRCQDFLFHLHTLLSNH